MSKRQYLRHETFDKAKEILPGQSEETYEFLHYFGQGLPEKYDVDEVLEEIRNLWDLMAYCPERLDPFDATLVAKNLSKIRDLFEKVANGGDLPYFKRKISHML